MSKPIPHSRLDIRAEEIEAVRRVVKSGQLAQGHGVERLEGVFAQRVGTRYAAATNSGTSALHLALMALGIGDGDEVVLPSYVCTAVLNAVQYVRAAPVLADIDETYNLCPGDVTRRLSRRTKAVIAVHLFGVPADVKALARLQAPIIEDCAHALGAELDGMACGSFGKAGVFSFYATKMIAAGEGGMVVSNSKRVVDETKDLRTYDEREDYRVRFNYKMTDMAAALALSQLSRLDAFVRRRRDIAKRYDDALKDAGMTARAGARRGHPSFFRYVVDFGVAASKVIRLFEREDICARRPVYRPLHHYLRTAPMPATDLAWQQAVSLPIYPSLTDQEVARVCRAIIRVGRQIRGKQT
ncbi:MAG: DegT/DnrJ/EryC1/StrS family aminotransferase [Planctomycetes bacterium]|nr:DegT/DnrJ/EryC1/StrS family aminotransferase [Planctomycetota bacterium]